MYYSLDRSRVAPEYWLNLDPYWKGTSPLMHRYVHEDGSQTADPVTRKKDWSWEMSNILNCYSSVPDGHRVGGTGPLLVCVKNEVLLGLPNTFYFLARYRITFQ
ncbi:F-box domain-containing protein [Citrus sinensis]|uniref:F-box domain-containing protein n=1 Tax=Citrus sinensis TaxID=2711 RepID=A0ACB8I2L6_CITSI|nr:F-box domain-containing protein [Citrus sinensis]